MSPARRFVRPALALAALTLCSAPAWAGPGEIIVQAAFESTGGRLFFGIFSVLFLPLVIYTIVTERLAERRTLRDLSYMAERDARFDWPALREHARDCFFRVHRAWSSEQVSTATEWMEDWYWQNQQLAHLNNWRRRELVNVCNIRKLTGIRPLFFSHRNEGSEHNNSVFVVQISAVMQEWLQARDGDAVVEGSKKWKSVNTVWTFRLRDGVWRVADIEAAVHSLQYARLVKQLPRIEETVYGLKA